MNSELPLLDTDSNIEDVMQGRTCINLSLFSKEIPKDYPFKRLINPSLDSSVYEKAQEISYEAEESNHKLACPQFIQPKGYSYVDRFEALQKWECIVLEVQDESFRARLIDLTQEGPDEEAEFSIQEVSEEDRKLIRRGSVFYWTIGYNDLKGQRTRESLIRFRRLPVWRERDIDAAGRRARELRESIHWK